MNWKRVFLLSLFGLVMGLGTVFFISSRVEPYCWLVIFLLSAWSLRAVARPFLNGLLVGIFNSVWITAAHILFLHTYLARHPPEAAMVAQAPISPRLLMGITGPMIGILSGAIIGVLAWIASRLLRRPTPTAG